MTRFDASLPRGKGFRKVAKRDAKGVARGFRKDCRNASALGLACSDARPRNGPWALLP